VHLITNSLVFISINALFNKALANNIGNFRAGVHVLKMGLFFFAWICLEMIIVKITYSNCIVMFPVRMGLYLVVVMVVSLESNARVALPGRELCRLLL